MNKSIHYILLICVCLMMHNGCATYRAHQVVPTPIVQAKEEIPEEALLDVGIVVFESGELLEEEAKDQGTNPEIRKAESHFIPYHLKNTLQQSSHWGAVRVVPAGTDEVDLVVKGEIIESNGEHLVLKIEVIDATGKTWMEKIYEEKATPALYNDNVTGQKDAYQALYNTIANDMAALKRQLNAYDIRQIRTISKLKFASDFAPEVFGDYLGKDAKGRTTINRIPADNDPFMKRLLRIRERDHMYVDTLNEYYEVFYNEMWPAYENWRKNNLTEQTALREMKRSSYARMAGGALMVALAIALGGEVNNTALLNAMVFAGGAVIINGINISKQAEIHAMAIQELSESFGNEMKPVVMEFQGKKYELTGSAEEQYARWRELLRKIYYAETGFGPDASPGDGEREPLNEN